jgi:hypothetical protein
VKRRLFNLAAAVSLAMMVAVVALWVGSYWRLYGWTHAHSSGSDTNIFVGQGILFVERSFTLVSRPEGAWSAAAPATTAPVPDPGVTRDWHALGFSWFVTRGGAQEKVSVGPVWVSWKSGPRWRLGLPLWLPALMCAVNVAGWSVWRARSPDQSACCKSCGYDLRATPDRCPECGATSGSTGLK